MEHIKEIFRREKNKDQGYLSLRRAIYMKGNIKTTKKMEWEQYTQKMEESLIVEK